MLANWIELHKTNKHTKKNLHAYMKADLSLTHNSKYLFGGEKVLKIVMFFPKVTFNTFQTNPAPIRAHVKHNIQNVQVRFFFHLII